MKSVLMIAYFFPPEGSAGAYRPTRFVRHLPTKGWAPTVICADPYSYERYDPDLLGSVPSETEIIRVRGHDLWQALQTWRGKRIRQKLVAASAEVANQILARQYKPFRSRIREAVRTLEAWYYQPDIARPWIHPAVQATVKLCARKHPDVIWATAGPISAWIVAQRASKITGVPYVLDLRDPHGLNYYESERQWPKSVKRAISRTMYQLFKGARASVFLFNSVAQCYYRVFPAALEAAKIHIIPNGYDGTIEEVEPPVGNKCTVLYTGTVTTYRYDTLLNSLVLLKNNDPNEAKRLRLHFIGEGMEAVARKAAALDLLDIVQATGPRSQNEIARFQQEADALLVLGRPSTMNGYELVAGAKLFEYLKRRRPIIGVLPQDETRRILLGLGVSTIADVDSPSEVVAVLRKILNAWSHGGLSSLLPDRVACEAYSADMQTIALVRALEGIPSEHPFIPGSVAMPPSLHTEFAA